MPEYVATTTSIVPFPRRSPAAIAIGSLSSGVTIGAPSPPFPSLRRTSTIRSLTLAAAMSGRVSPSKSATARVREVPAVA